MPILKARASKGKVGDAISYVLNKAKSTLKVILNLNPGEDYAKQMERTVRMWGKDKSGSRQFYHFKLAFHPDDSDRQGGPLTDWIAIQIATKIVKEFFPGYQAVLSVHNDTEHKHVHMIISAVHPTTGKKINMNDSDYRRMKDRADELSLEYGLTTIGWREAVRKKRGEEILPNLPVNYCFAEQGMHGQGKASWKDELRCAIEAARAQSGSLDEFREYLADSDVILTRCTEKGIVYKYKDYPPVRGDTLGGDYTFAAIWKSIHSFEDWLNDRDVSVEDAELYRSWGRFAGVRQAEVDAVVEEIHRATWQQKQEVWAMYRESKESFWNEYKRRRTILKNELDEAYRHRHLVKDAQWVLDPRNRNRSLIGIIFAAIILHRFGNREFVESEIRNLRSKMELLRQESVEFRNQSEAAILNLRRRELTLDQYLLEVRRMQDMAEGMFRQPSQELAMRWSVERKEWEKEPTLDKYLKMCESNQNKQEEKDDERELRN